MDIKITQDEDTKKYSIRIANGDLELTDGLDSSISVSLLSNARAVSDQVLTPDRREGWLGDVVQDSGRPMGSSLWLQDQRRLTQENLNGSITSGRESLDWMTEDDIATSVNVTGEIIPKLGNRLNIEFTSKTGVTSNQYVNLWENTTP